MFYQLPVEHSRDYSNFTFTGAITYEFRDIIKTVADTQSGR